MVTLKLLFRLSVIVLFYLLSDKEHPFTVPMMSDLNFNIYTQKISARQNFVQFAEAISIRLKSCNISLNYVFLYLKL